MENAHVEIPILNYLLLNLLYSVAAYEVVSHQLNKYSSRQFESVLHARWKKKF
jgi:hypothetical protein